MDGFNQQGAVDALCIAAAGMNGSAHSHRKKPRGLAHESCSPHKDDKTVLRLQDSGHVLNSRGPQGPRLDKCISPPA